MLENMDDPGLEGIPKPESRPRTPHGDALVFGPAALAWLVLAAVLGHDLALPVLWWAIVTAVVTLMAAAAARLAAGATVTALWWVLAFCASGAWLAWSRFADLKTPAPWLWLAAPAAV